MENFSPAEMSSTSRPWAKEPRHLRLYHCIRADWTFRRPGPRSTECRYRNSSPASPPEQSKCRPATPDWLHEIKLDGYRLIVQRDGDRVRLFTRNGYDWSHRYPDCCHCCGVP